MKRIHVFTEKLRNVVEICGETNSVMWEKGDSMFSGPNIVAIKNGILWGLFYREQEPITNLHGERVFHLLKAVIRDAKDWRAGAKSAQVRTVYVFADSTGYWFYTDEMAKQRQKEENFKLDVVPVLCSDCVRGSEFDWGKVEPKQTTLS